MRSEEHTSELQSQFHLVCRLLLEKKKLHWASYTTVTRGLAARQGGRTVQASAAAYLRDSFIFFFHHSATTDIYTLSLHDALPILRVDDDRPATAEIRREPEVVDPAERAFD